MKKIFVDERQNSPILKEIINSYESLKWELTYLRQWDEFTSDGWYKKSGPIYEFKAEAKGFNKKLIKLAGKCWHQRDNSLSGGHREERIKLTIVNPNRIFFAKELSVYSKTQHWSSRYRNAFDRIMNEIIIPNG